MGIDLGSLEFYAGPKILGAPDDLDSVIRQFLGGAKKKLHIAVQELDSRAVADAVLAAKARGVAVRVILEGDYLMEDPPLEDPWSESGSNENNRVIDAALRRAGVDLITDLNPEIFHQKFIVRDPGESSAAVLTGSANFTLTDTGTNDGGNNLNHIVILHGQSASDQYEDEFQRLWSGTFGETHERHESRPAEFRLSHIRIKPVFAPEQGPEMEIMKQMLKSKKSIDFAMFTFASSSGIDDTMFRLVDELDRLRGVLDRGQAEQEWSATVPLKAAGVELYKNREGIGVRKVHHKLMVIDEALVIVGSFNYTEPAATLNDENIVVIGDLEEADPEALAAQQEFAKYALAEIDRMIGQVCEAV